MLSVKQLFPAAILVTLLMSCGGKENKHVEQDNSKVKDTSRTITTDIDANPYVVVDISPMDMSYFPIDYPKLKMAKATKEPPLARVIYSRPHLQGRRLFHEVQKYGEPWRLGANESTEIQFYSDATIMDKKVKAGRYVMYCIPQPDTWTIILNSNIDTWGLAPDSTKDVMHFTIPAQQTGLRLEYYTMLFEKTDKGANLVMAWDNLEARLPIKF